MLTLRRSKLKKDSALQEKVSFTGASAYLGLVPFQGAIPRHRLSSFHISTSTVESLTSVLDKVGRSIALARLWSQLGPQFRF